MEYFRHGISPVLGHFDSERAHILTRDGLYLMEQTPRGLDILEKFAYGGRRFADSRLEIGFAGIRADNPLFVGAGWSKNGKGLGGLHRLGFAGGEAGTILLYSQPGNEKPRQEVLSNGATWNALEFNQDEEIEDIEQILEKYSRTVVQVGGSVGGNKVVKDADIPEVLASTTKIILPQVGWITLNHATPNTQDRRQLLAREHLRSSSQAIMGTMSDVGIAVPYFIKLSPDMSLQQIDDALDVAIEVGAAGVIGFNTTANRKIKSKYYNYKIKEKYGERFLDMGGLAGGDLEYQGLCDNLTAHIYKQVGDRLVIWGVGGVNSAETAYRRIKAGAGPLQVVSGIREVGPTMPGRVNQGLIQLMERDGVKNISEVVGQEAHLYSAT